ncbi:MAG: hypothetical protein DRI44_10080 [Chlamydiae bacterium]|nr:MAG: hypothetical protein DRI44_10080 [Chlamydiota bacterium]
MPRGDRTGPDGMGPMTGRGLGYCSGYDSPGYTKGTPRGGAGYGGRFFGNGGGYGRGFGRGVGYGRGFSWRASAPYASSVPYEPQDELRALKNEAKQMKESLEAVNERIGELEKK